MTLRWPLVGSLVALIAGAGLAALVLAFCGGGEDEPGVIRSPTRTPFSRTVTVTRTPSGGTPGATPTPTRTVSASTPEDTATPSSGEPPQETPQPSPPPPPVETGSPGPQPTLAPGETPAFPSPTLPAGTSTPVSPGATPSPTPTRTPGGPLPDLVLLDIFVSNDVVGVSLGNVGHATVPAGQEIEIQLRSVAAEKITLTQALPPGASTPFFFEGQVIYRPELALAVVDPDDAIAEEDNHNNDFAKQIMPDVTLDMAVHNVVRDTTRLLVVIRNNCDAPMVQVEAMVTVYSGDSTNPAGQARFQFTIEPQGFETVQIPGVAAVPGWQLRVVVEMTDLPDADLTNNEWQGTIS